MKGVFNIIILFGVSTVLCNNSVKKSDDFSSYDMKNMFSDGKFNKFKFPKNDVKKEVVRNEIVSEIASESESHANNESELKKDVVSESTEDSESSEELYSEEKVTNSNNGHGTATNDFESKSNEDVKSKKEKRIKSDRKRFERRGGRGRREYTRYSKEKRHEIFSRNEDSKDWTHQELPGNFPTMIGSTNAAENGDKLKSTNLSSVKYYICMVDEDIEDELIIYGTKAWTFPQQDVNLTLTYPTTTVNEKSDPAYTFNASEDLEFIITGFKVMLYIDGVQSRGYIVSGGVLQDSLSLSFFSSNITSLLYKFWLYGVPKTLVSEVEMNDWNYLCS